MSTGITGTLFVPWFANTGVSGEYIFEEALYNNQTDTSGDGAYAITAGFIMYISATNVDNGMQIIGKFHRYKLTNVTIINSGTLSGTIMWDEVGPPTDIPSSGCNCIVSSPSPNLQLGTPSDDQIYPELPAGASLAVFALDLTNVVDNVVSALRPPDLTTYTYTADGNVAESFEQIGTNQRISSYTYDNEGNVVSISESFMGINKLVTLAYDTNGNVSSITSTIV